MTRFYNVVFEANLTPFVPAPFRENADTDDVTFYRGHLVGINLLFCPNAVAGIEARTNRQQFNFAVDDVVRVMRIALQSGGTQIDAPQLVDDVLTASVRDPDGNSIEFIQLETDTTSAEGML